MAFFDKDKQVKLQDIHRYDDDHYVYKGEEYRFSGDFKSYISKFWALGSGAFLAALTGGLLPATGAMNTWYVILPYAATLIGTCLMLYRLYKWSAGKGVLRAYEYQRTAKGAKNNILAIGIGAFVTFLGEAFYLIGNGMGDHPTGAIVLLVTMAITLAISIVMRIHNKYNNWEKFPNNE